MACVTLCRGNKQLNKWTKVIPFMILFHQRNTHTNRRSSLVSWSSRSGRGIPGPAWSTGPGRIDDWVSFSSPGSVHGQRLLFVREIIRLVRCSYTACCHFTQYPTDADSAPVSRRVKFIPCLPAEDTSCVAIHPGRWAVALLRQVHSVLRPYVQQWSVI